MLISWNNRYRLVLMRSPHPIVIGATTISLVVRKIFKPVTPSWPSLLLQADPLLCHANEEVNTACKGIKPDIWNLVYFRWFFRALIIAASQLTISVVAPGVHPLLVNRWSNCSEEASDEKLVDRYWKNDYFGLQKLPKTARAPYVQITFTVKSATMVPSCNRDDIVELSNMGWVALVDLVPDSQLAILVVSHPKNLTTRCQYDCIEDSTLDLFDSLCKVD